MGRKRNSSRRHRRRRFGFLYKILSILAICAVVVVALTLFFKVDTIQVSGQSHYTRQQVLSASGVQPGDNLFLLNKYDAANRIIEKLPYVETVRINRKLPDCLLISVQECTTVFSVSQNGVSWLISPGGKIVDSSKGSAPAPGVPTIDGCTLLAPSVGSRLAVAQSQESLRTSLLSLLSALEKAKLTAEVNAVHLGDSSVLTMDFGGRFSVVMPYGADYPHLLKYLTAVIGTLETNQTGTIDLTKDGEPHFRPD
ncbi:MAG: FtsQ-type POTRA domain-containing protein [Oscillibacter sp.]|jgi:cell division protein FtsQ|nr:FtsQ-type POTRA domain-containing protein [Oscillibacter sp.]